MNTNGLVLISMFITTIDSHDTIFYLRSWWFLVSYINFDYFHETIWEDGLLSNACQHDVNVGVLFNACL